MLLIIGALAIVTALVSTLRIPGGVDAANLGSMSEQWLAEHRARHLS